MRITLYSLVMACIWTSALGGIICVIQKSKRTIQYFGLNIMIISYGFCIVRMAVPIELSVSRIVPVKGLYNVITRLYAKTVIGDTVQAGEILLLVWGCGMVIRLLLTVKDYRAARRMVCNFDIQNGSMAQELLKQMQKEKGDTREIPIYTTSLLVPMEMGILHPAVFLPTKEYTQQDLYYIVKHEYTHILNHDTTVKLILNLWSSVFWWNPIVYLLCADIENTLELRCDLTATDGMAKEERAEYLSAILRVIQTVKNEKIIGEVQKLSSKSFNALYKMHRQRGFIVKRFRCVSECRDLTEKVKIKYKIYTTIVLMLCVVIFYLSYMFVLQSKFEVPSGEMEKGEGIIYVVQPDAVFLREKGGKYEVISEGQKITEVDKDTAMIMKQRGFEIK